RGGAYAELNRPERAIEDYNKAIKLNPNLAEAYANRGFSYAEIEKHNESTRDLKRAGILFFYSGRVDGSANVFSFCFHLREKIENDDVIYCSLALYLITLNPDAIMELRRMRIQDETLRTIRELTMRKLQNEDISEEVRVLEEREKREEMSILLELLKRF
ncbi:MAG: tetratricopeptide repeat protein, partial [Thermotogota bacterium]|nr:tetratricopeptide repeat protein [Thermotogota bacterium]